MTPFGARSAALTITRTCSMRSRPAANAARVASYFDCNNPASHTPPRATSRRSPVNRANHASVPVSAEPCATWRRSASAANANRHDTTCDSNAASSATACANRSSPHASAPSPAPCTTAARAAPTSSTACRPGSDRSCVTLMRHTPPATTDNQHAR